MDLQELELTTDKAVDLVVSVINKAQAKLGVRQNLYQIAYTRNALTNDAILKVNQLKPPLAYNSQRFIREAIEKTWNLIDVFKYHIKYLGGSNDECSHYYYFEVVFSQPTAQYPIPQTTCSVFFTVEDKHTAHPAIRRSPLMTFRVEGHHQDHDVRSVMLIPDWILAVLMMKMRFYRRIEMMGTF